MTKNPVIRTQSKHIALDLHFVKEHVEAKDLQISHVSSVDQHPNIFTKPFHKDRFCSLCHKFQVCPTHELDGGNNDIQFQVQHKCVFVLPCVIDLV